MGMEGLVSKSGEPKVLVDFRLWCRLRLPQTRQAFFFQKIVVMKITLGVESALHKMIMVC
jgi:hypothetical protein